MFRLYKGDCLRILPILINTGIKVDTIICDPPFGKSAKTWDNPLSFQELWKLFKQFRKPTTNVLVFSKQPYTSMVNESNIKEFRYELIWEKSQKAKPYSSEKEFVPTHENISVFYEKLGVCNPQVLGTKSKPIYPNSILTFDEVKKGKHPAQKPADLLEYLIKTYSNEDDIVLDCTMGSGSTGIACVKLNRNFIGIESSDKYFKIAEKEIK